jgi:hypothetical protein
VVTLNISNQATYSSQLLMEFIFLTLFADFYAAANESLALNGAPSVTIFQLVHSLDTLLARSS